MKRTLLVLIIGAAAGGAVMYNVMNDRDPLSNPFKSDSLLEQMKDSGADLIEDTVDDLKDNIEEKLNK
jgi:hypothetical protein